MKLASIFFIAAATAGLTDAFSLRRQDVTRHCSASRLTMASAAKPGSEPRLNRACFVTRKSTKIKVSSLPLSYNQLPPLSQIKQWFVRWGSRGKKFDEVSMWRGAAATFVSSLFFYHSFFDRALFRFWDFLQNGNSLLPLMFRHDHWEWMLAVGCFFVYIHGFYVMDRAVIGASRQGRVHPWKKFRLQDRYEAQKFRREQLRRQERGEEVDFTQQPPVLVEQSQWNWQAWVFELPLYVLPLFIWDIMIPRRAAKLVMWSAPTTYKVCKDVVAGLLLYDIMFFFGHFLMHKIPFVYNRVHKKHHINPECRAAEIVRLSAVEEVLEVGMSIIALNFLRAHPISRSIYNCIITFLLTELHCGFDLPWTPQNVIPFGLATGSRRHHFHHRNGKHYYQKFFCHVDRLFGFYQKQDGSLHGESVQPWKDNPSSWDAKKA
jgi:sterol desaturase/sphingolipid hydroxylase (fatty acid hydroxylase superfamily)